MYSMAISSRDEIVGNSWWQVEGVWHAGLVSSTDKGESWSINEFNRSAGDTFAKSYYKSKGILPHEYNLDDIVKALQKANNG